MLADLRSRLRRNRLWLHNQMAGRRWPIGCVSLEVTQRCNLDCTLCYLSEHAETVRDLPLEEIFRRIEMIHAQFGPGTDIQISGGEPTLRTSGDLVNIVRRIGALGMRSSLFTNGIRATRALLIELAAAGLDDVAFHVDTTQQRKGYTTEASLNCLRDEYIARAHGLPIAVFFNTSVHDANLHELPLLAAYFASRAGAVRTASLQLQARTGRGVLGTRGEGVSIDGVIERIRQGIGAPLSFDSFLIGHPSCNRYAAALVIGGRAFDLFADREFAVDFMRRTAHARIDRHTPLAGALSLARAALGSPRIALRAIGWLARLLWRTKLDLLRARGRVRKISFFLHNFMNADGLDAERVDSCVFMAATADGPMSMCAFNARRDEILPRQTGEKTAVRPIKWLKGRARATVVAAAAIALEACSVRVAVPDVEATSETVALTAYSRVLQRFVDDRGAVNFTALAKDRRDLDMYVRHIADVSPGDGVGRNVKIAHYINSYNSLAMYNVIERGVPQSLDGLEKINFFVLRKFSVGGKILSLYAYENELIRPTGEERVHFALNCMVVSCPRLPSTPFRPEDLEQSLDRETRRFLNESRNVRIDAATGTVYFSEILKFYAEDFLAKAPSLIAYVNRYRIQPVPAHYAVRFIPYDWNVNAQSPSP